MPTKLAPMMIYLTSRCEHQIGGCLLHEFVAVAVVGFWGVEEQTNLETRLIDLFFSLSLPEHLTYDLW